MELYIDIFHFIGIFFILLEIFTFFNSKTILKFYEKNNIPYQKDIDEYIFEYINLFYIIWIIIGLISNEYIIFIIILLCSFIPRVSHRLIKLDALITIILLSFILVNHFVLHIKIPFLTIF